MKGGAGFTIGVSCLGVTGRQRADLAELLEGVHAKLVAHEMQGDVLEGTTVDCA